MGVNLPPPASGTSTMSRGIDTIETVFPTGSSEATIIVSVSAVFRPTPESTPMSRTVIRGWLGVGLGDGEPDAPADGSGVSKGSSEIVGNGAFSSTPLSPMDGPNIAWSVFWSCWV